MQVGVLVCQFPPRRLRPHHERIHGPLHVRLALVAGVHAHGHGHEGPVVAVQHLAHRLADTDGETVVLFVRFDGEPACSNVCLVVHPRQLGLLIGRRVSPTGLTGGVTWRQGVAVVRDPWTHLYFRQTLLLSRHLLLSQKIQLSGG